MLELKQINYRYQNSKKQVLKDVNMTFEEGKFYAILGTSGSGKTTLLSLLAGLDYPSKGQYFIKVKILSQKDMNIIVKNRFPLFFKIIILSTICTNGELKASQQKSRSTNFIRLRFTRR